MPWLTLRTDMPNTVEFELLPNSPAVRGHIRIFSLVVLTGLTLVLVAFAVGWVSGVRALIAGVMLIIFLAISLWEFNAMGRGAVETSADRILLRSRSGRQVYTWTDIAEVRLNNMRRTGSLDRIYAAITRIDADLPFVELRLKRWLRVSLLFNEIGSMRALKFGIPGLMAKSVRIYVRDPEGLVRVANSYLRAGPLV